MAGPWYEHTHAREMMEPDTLPPATTAPRKDGAGFEIEWNVHDAAEAIVLTETDDFDEEWCRGELDKMPIRKLYPRIAEAAPGILARWKARFGDTEKVWKRFWKRGRVLKELNEYGPVIDRVLATFSEDSFPRGPVTIIDLCR
jgi:hypothetical protein